MYYLDLEGKIIYFSLFLAVIKYNFIYLCYLFMDLIDIWTNQHL